MEDIILDGANKAIVELNTSSTLMIENTTGVELKFREKDATTVSAFTIKPSEKIHVDYSVEIWCSVLGVQEKIPLIRGV